MENSAMTVTKNASRLGFAVSAIMLAAMSSGHAQVPLSAYTDANGYIDVQALTCAQLAGTFQEDADYLASWYSGWYNGLAKKHFAHITRAKSGEHQVIVYCKQHPDVKVIQAIDVLLKNEK
jgi:HdeA/HdeB family